MESNQLNTPDSRIVSFLRKNKLLSLATSADNIPYCALCFYAYCPENNTIIFASRESTRHGREALQNEEVAGTISPGGKSLKFLQGLQLTGKLHKAGKQEIEEAKRIYIKRFPFARLSGTPLWILQPEYYKLTDNRLGKKLRWERSKNFESI